MKEYIVKVYENRTVWRNKEGSRHREDGPAVEWSNGYKYWYINGLLHREDGPAVEHNNGDKYWYRNGICVSEQEFNIKTSTKTSCEDKVIEIDGVKYKLVEVKV